MNEYKLVNNMNDPRWTNNLKCNIFKHVADFVELEKHARLTKKDATLQRTKKKLKNLKIFKKNYNPMLKEAYGHHVSRILSVTNDKKLVKRYTNIHPDEIKQSIRRSIHGITYEINRLNMQIKDKKEKLKYKHDCFLEQYEGENTPIDHAKKTRVKITSIRKKTELVESMNTHIEQMVRTHKEDSLLYDSYFEQLRNDVASTSMNLMRELERSQSIKKDIGDNVRRYQSENTANTKSAHKAKLFINIFNSASNSLKQNRYALIGENVTTEKEKEFYSQIRWKSDSSDDLSHNTSNNNSFNGSRHTKKSLANDGGWYKNLLNFGIMYFVDPDEPSQLFNDLKNNTLSSSIDYKFPTDISEYLVSMNNYSNTTDELAMNYLLKITQFNTLEDLCKSVENTKYDSVKLNRLIAMRKSIWQFFIKRCIYAQEGVRNLNLETKQDAEYSKQVENFKSIISEQQTELSNLETTKTHYVVLLNDLYFYMGNIQKILEQVDFSVDDTKRNSNTTLTSTVEPTEATDIDLSKLLEELKSIVYKVDQKIRRCHSIVDQLDFSPDKLNLAHALYVFKNQDRIQNKKRNEKKMNLNDILRRRDTFGKPDISDDIVLTRLDIKKQADQIVKYFNEKDLDSSKNKRKPISFRRSFM